MTAKIENSFIVYNVQGQATSFVGTDAMRMYQAATLAQALKLLAVGIVPTRGFTQARGLAQASNFTGKPYKRSELGLAIRDLHVWVQEMKDALPHQVRE